MTGEITPQQAERHLDALTEIVSRAAAATLAMPFSSVERRLKHDLSPVTSADEASEAVIVEGVSRVLPGIPVIAEESVSRAAAASLEPSFVVVDPLDGTKEFLAGRDEFTVNVAIVTHGVPIAGIVAAPAQGLLWRGVVGGKAERLRLRFGGGPADAYDRSFIRTRAAPDRLVVATSRSHLDDPTEDFLARLPVARRLSAAVANTRMGYRGRLRDPDGRWRRGDRPERRSTPVRTQARKISGPRIHRLGRSGQGHVDHDMK